MYGRKKHRLMEGAIKDPTHPKFWIVPEATANQIIAHIGAKGAYIGSKEMSRLIGCSLRTTMSWLNDGIIPSVQNQLGHRKVLQEVFFSMLDNLKLRLKVTKYVKWGKHKGDLPRNALAEANKAKSASLVARKVRKVESRRKTRHKTKIVSLTPQVAELRQELRASRVGIRFKGAQPRSEREIIFELNRLQILLNNYHFKNKKGHPRQRPN